MLTAGARLRDHPMLADGVLAVLLFSLSLDQWPDSLALSTAAAVLVSALLAATVLLRRRYPVAAFTAAMMIAAAQVLFGMQAGGGDPAVRALEPTATDVVIPVLLYTVAAHRPRRVSVTALAVCLLATGVAITRWAPSPGLVDSGLHRGRRTRRDGPGRLGAGRLDGLPYRREYYASLEERTARAEAERDAQAQIAAAAERARELQERRASAVDESAARLRRIERDLHDGAQVRLTALAMTLGEIKENLERRGPGGRRRPTRMLADAAHRNAKETIAELRDLARGIHPAVLDRGLEAALSALAQASTIPARLNVSMRAAAFAGDRGHRLLLRRRTAGQCGQAQRSQPRHYQRQRSGRGAADDGGRRRDRRGPAAPAAGLAGLLGGCRPLTGASARQPARWPDCRHDRAAGPRLMAPQRLRIVIAEDAAIMRDGLTQTLTRRGHDVVAAVGDAVRSGRR